MALSERQQEEAARLLLAYPAGVGFGADKTEAIRIYDSLVAIGHATVITEQDDPQLPAGGRSYVLSQTAAETHRQEIQRRADEANLN